MTLSLGEYCTLPAASVSRPSHYRMIAVSHTRCTALTLSHDRCQSHCDVPPTSYVSVYLRFTALTLLHDHCQSHCDVPPTSYVSVCLRFTAFTLSHDRCQFHCDVSVCLRFTALTLSHDRCQSHCDVPPTSYVSVCLLVNCARHLTRLGTAEQKFKSHLLRIQNYHESYLLFL